MQKTKNKIWRLFALVPVAPVALADGPYGPIIKPGTKDIVSTMLGIINYATIAIGVLGVIVFIYAGFLYMTAGGDQSKIEKAKSVMTYAIVGLVVAILGYVAVFTINKVFV